MRRTLHPLWQAWMKSSSSFPKRKTLAILFLNSRCSRTFRQDLFMPQLSHSHEWLLGMKSMTPSLVRVFKTLTKASVSHWRYYNVLRLGNEDELFILFGKLGWRVRLHPKLWTLAILFLNSRCSRTFRQDLFMPQLSHSHEWLLLKSMTPSLVRVFKTRLKASVSHWRYCQCLAAGNEDELFILFGKLGWRVRLHF